MSLDIPAALNNHSPRKGDKRCKLQTILDDIPADEPGKDQLVAAVDDGQSFPASHLTLTFSAIGHPVGADLISDHRAERCRCYR